MASHTNRYVAGLPSTRLVGRGREEAHPHRQEARLPTHDQIKSALGSGAVNSERMEDVLAMFSETGVNVVETAEVGPHEDDQPEESEEEESERAEGF